MHIRNLGIVHYMQSVVTCDQHDHSIDHQQSTSLKNLYHRPSALVMGLSFDYHHLKTFRKISSHRFLWCTTMHAFIHIERILPEAVTMHLHASQTGQKLLKLISNCMQLKYKCLVCSTILYSLHVQNLKTHLDRLNSFYKSYKL